MADVVLDQIEITYGGRAFIKDLDLKVGSGEFVSLLGPSGSGKTSLLRSVGGYQEISDGRILLGGIDVAKLPPQRRNIGMVFQSFALFPNMTVAKNVAFGLKTRRLASSEIKSRVAETLALVGLTGFEERFPHQLSGGQQQRVALARAIAIRPAVLLMDEPLGALDSQLREAVQIEIKRVQTTLGITTLYVTHDQNEAIAMSDRIVVMSEGEIAEEATPDDLYARPRSLFAARFLGHAAVIPVDVVRSGTGRATVTIKGLAAAPIEVSADGLDESAPAFLVVPPEQISASAAVEPNGTGVVGRVLSRRFVGSVVLLSVDIGCARMVVEDRTHQVQIGDSVAIEWNPAAARVMQ